MTRNVAVDANLVEQGMLAAAEDVAQGGAAA